MSFPNFPNPARRARILQAQQLREQGLTLREIAKIMGCAHSTVAGYLRDYELFRFDLIGELAADQIVGHALRLADVADEHHGRRLAAMRECRMLLKALPEMRRDEGQRTGQLLNGSVQIDRYGNRYPVPNRMFPPTEEEQRQSLEPPAKLPAGRPDPDVPLYCPPLPEPAPVQDETPPPSSEDALVEPSESAETAPIRTESNKTEQESAPNPAQDGGSADSDQDSEQSASDPAIHTLQEAIDRVDRQLKRHLQYRDWLKDYPSHNPWHPERKKALRLVERKQSLEAQLAEITSNPAAT